MKLTHGEIKLERRQLIKIHNGEGVVVIGRAGSVWITQEGDSRDVIVNPGEMFVIDHPGQTIVEAAESSLVSIVSIAEPRALTGARSIMNPPPAN